VDLNEIGNGFHLCIAASFADNEKVRYGFGYFSQI
jgi:hypothetical protein